MDIKTVSKTYVREIVEFDLNTENEWKVVLFNCYCHTYDEVVFQIVLSLNCSYVAGCRYADSAERFGSVDVYAGSFHQCTKIANILGNTGLDVRIAQ